MTAPAGSWQKVFYDLRPGKQIERRMIIDTLQILGGAGFPVRDYQYTGFGAIYFVDFVLFHKLLGMRRLLSLEHDERIARRVEFNKPYAEIQIKMESASDVIPTLNRDRKHLLWLDYDFRLNQTAVSDSSLAAYNLSPGSIILVTVDVKPPVDQGTPEDSHQYYEQEASRFIPAGWTATDFTQERLPHANAQILFNAIENGVASRDGVSFAPLFNFLYADGHPMLTVGGMIVTDIETRLLRSCDFSASHFVRQARSEEPYHIRVPRLTRKERALLDHNMPSEDSWKPEEFELEQSEIHEYRAIYRFYPAYAELLL